MGIVYEHIEVSVISYVFITLFISIGIKRIIIMIPILLIMILFFIFDICKYKKLYLINTVSIILLIAKIPCIIYTQNVWVEFSDILDFFSRL